jgi:hypothetical protein
MGLSNQAMGGRSWSRSSFAHGPADRQQLARPFGHATHRPVLVVADFAELAATLA